MIFAAPLFFQGQGGVNTASLSVTVAAGGERWGQGRRRGSQDLLGPAFLSQMLMLMLLQLGWWMLRLPGECGVGCLIFGRAVKLCWGGVGVGVRREDINLCKETTLCHSLNWVLKPPVNIK